MDWILGVGGELFVPYLFFGIRKILWLVGECSYFQEIQAGVFKDEVL